MSFHAMANGEHDDYVAFFAACLAEAREASPDTVAEILVKPNGATNPPPFCLARIDLLSGPADAPRVRRIVGGKPDLIAAERQFELVAGLAGTVTALSWESFAVAFRHERFDLSAFRGWLEKWLDVSEQHPEDAYGLSGVVHSIAWSHEEPDDWQITVDFGSAPTEALFEFLSLLVTNGVARCRIFVADSTDSPA